ncbi:hypothetical protein [Streptomyces sp. NBC_00096]|uniref:hypothetical protein n=1 Tax=Streptomyces sp. NBC_00096 TaxID=2975650 RepID=UPI00325028BF
MAPLPDHRHTGDPAWQRAWAEFELLTTPLRERGLVCDIAEGHTSKLVYAYPPGHDSVFIIGPEDGGWLVTHQAPAEDWSDFSVVYDSRAGSTPPAGSEAEHDHQLTPLLAAVDAYVSRRLRVPAVPTPAVPRQVGPTAGKPTHTR